MRYADKKAIARTIWSLFLLFLLSGCNGNEKSNDNQGPDDDGPPTASAIIDHTCTQLDSIPETWINQARTNLRIAYGYSSHGSQIITGMSGLISFKGDLYRYNGDGADGALELRECPFSNAADLGNPDRTTWAADTRIYLNAHPTINVIMWSWCGQVSDATEADITTYLNLMNELEHDYPNVQFVYMTGHLDGTGLNGNLHTRNEQIRKYCRDNAKILYDFADIESYDPDGNGYLSLYANDGCFYDGNNLGYPDSEYNWALQWQESHTPGVDWFDCDPAHTMPLNANQKAYAAWWLWARLTGWDGR